MLTSTHRVAILLHEGVQGTYGKTGLAMARFSPAQIVAIVDQQSAGQSFAALTGIGRDIPIVATVNAAIPYHPDVLVIGIAPSGGGLPEAGLTEVKQAIAAGWSIANGLHTPLATLPDLPPLRPGQWIWDIRQEPTGLAVGSGQARSLPSRRVLTVGTDMSVGKMSASLAMHQVAQQQGLRSRFLGTGQGGILIAGDGIPLDAIRVDFAAGAVEQLVMRYGQDFDLLHIEGQGSLLHPASTATLPLIRGSQPTHLILVHRAGQTHIRTLPDFVIPPLPEVIALYESLVTAGGTFHPAKVVGIALNTAHLTEDEAQRAIALTQAETNLPCTDAVRFGAEPLLAAVLST
jgi:uncharacterized NAD-dependent epimerase/dehydratase family protein